MSGGPLSDAELTIGRLLETVAAEDPERVALVEGIASPHRRRWSYHDLWLAAVNTGHELLTLCSPGDRLAICAPNIPEWVILEYGAATAGVVVLGVNPASTETEMTYFLEHSGARVLATISEYRGVDLGARAREALRTVSTLEHVIDLDEWSPSTGIADGEGLPSVQPRDPALIQYTSGTTGRPKGAVLTHAGLLTNPRHAMPLLGLGPFPTLLNVMPMYHVAGSQNNSLGILCERGVNVLQRWDPTVALRLIEELSVTYFTAVPTMLIAMMDHPEIGETDTSAMQYVTTGGTVVTPSLVRRINAVFGCDVGVIYGQTESGGIISMSRRGDSIEKTTTRVGLPIPTVQVKIAEIGTSRDLQVGSVGEICVSSPSIMTGYHADPELTADVLVDGWVATGDLGLIDEDGYVQITGRLKDVIIRGGENVFAREIEDCLTEHPEVAEAAVVGVPSPRLGEEVAAFVRLRPGSHTTEDELDIHCRAVLAPFKVPRVWVFRDSFPLTASGKVRKQELKNDYVNATSGTEVRT